MAPRTKAPQLTYTQIRRIRAELKRQWQTYDPPPFWVPPANEVCSFEQVLGPHQYGWTDREDVMRFSPDGDDVLIKFPAAAGKGKARFGTSGHAGISTESRPQGDSHGSGMFWNVVLRVNGRQRYLYRSRELDDSIGWLHQLAEDCEVKLPKSSCIPGRAICREYQKNV